MKTVAPLILLLACAAPALADGPLLSVTGPDTARDYDLAALEAFAPVRFTTSTIWTEAPAEFTGVPLRRILADAGITEGAVLATAINDYAVRIPLDEITDDHPIVAYRVDGRTLSVRDKGPLWIVYPYDSDPDLRSEVVYSRSIWQLDRLAVAE